MSRRDYNRDVAVGGGGVMILSEVDSCHCPWSVELELTVDSFCRRAQLAQDFLAPKALSFGPFIYLGICILFGAKPKLMS